MLPFFDESHRKLKAELIEKVKSIEISMINEESSEIETAKRYVKELGNLGFLKYSVPKLDVRSICLCRELFAFRSGLLDFAFAMQGLGSGPISLFGNENERKRFLDPVSRGEKIAAFALSEANAGSDPSRLSTTAKKQGEFYIINGEKSWISNGGFADFYVTFAKTEEGLSCFIVEDEVSIKEQVRIGSPHPVATILFREAKGKLLGKLGDGLKIALSTLDVFRPTVAAAALGLARRALKESIDFIKAREVFGQKLSEFQMTQDKIATMATEIEASELLIYKAAWLKDSGQERITKEASMAKLYATESAQRVIDSAVQLFGGLGVTVGSVVERLYRDIRPLRIYEGTSEIQKLIIARKVYENSAT